MMIIMKRIRFAIQSRVTCVFLLGLFLFSACGCAKLRHLPQLLTIKRYSENSDLKTEFVQEENNSFEKILATVEDGSIGKYKTRDEVRQAFGPPVFRRDRQTDDQMMDVWLYRKGVKYFHGKKVYLYFDEQGALLRWEILEDPKQQQGT